MNKNLKSLSLTALFAALILVATAYLKIPIALGYVHLGDVFIVIGCFMLPVPMAVGVAALGSMLADLIAGYVVYMPVTFFAKGVMALAASLIYYKKFRIWKAVLGSLAGSLIMVFAYFIFEGFMYGFPVAAANIPAQLLQPLVAVPVGNAICAALSKIRYVAALKEEISIKYPALRRISADKKPYDTMKVSENTSENTSENAAEEHDREP